MITEAYPVPKLEYDGIIYDFCGIWMIQVLSMVLFFILMAYGG